MLIAGRLVSAATSLLLLLLLLACFTLLSEAGKKREPLASVEIVPLPKKKMNAG